MSNRRGGANLAVMSRYLLHHRHEAPDAVSCSPRSRGMRARSAAARRSPRASPEVTRSGGRSTRRPRLTRLRCCRSTSPSARRRSRSARCRSHECAPSRPRRTGGTPDRLIVQRHRRDHRWLEPARLRLSPSRQPRTRSRTCNPRRRCADPPWWRSSRCATLGLYTLHHWYDITRDLAGYGRARDTDALGNSPGGRWPRSFPVCSSSSRRSGRRSRPSSAFRPHSVSTAAPDRWLARPRPVRLRVAGLLRLPAERVEQRVGGRWSRRRSASRDRRVTRPRTTKGPLAGPSSLVRGRPSGEGSRQEIRLRDQGGAPMSGDPRHDSLLRMSQGGDMSSDAIAVNAVLASAGDWRALAGRDTDGLAVSLLWNAATECSEGHGRRLEARRGVRASPIAGANALEAFHRPLPTPRPRPELRRRRRRAHRPATGELQRARP